MLASEFYLLPLRKPSLSAWESAGSDGTIENDGGSQKALLFVTVEYLSITCKNDSLT